MTDLRVGNGFDVHRLTTGRKLILGGVEIAHNKGLDGHSDADVLVHAIMDALLGAASMGDIGVHFPPDDNAFKDADSIGLLEKVMTLVRQKGYGTVVNIDATIMAEKPKLRPFVQSMEERIAAVVGVASSRINIKSTTTERLGMIGREEGIAASAVVLLEVTPHE